MVRFEGRKGREHMMQLYIHKFSEIKEIIRKSDLTDSPKALYPEKYFVYFITFLK